MGNSEGWMMRVKDEGWQELEMMEDNKGDGGDQRIIGVDES